MHIIEFRKGRGRDKKKRKKRKRSRKQKLAIGVGSVIGAGATIGVMTPLLSQTYHRDKINAGLKAKKFNADLKSFAAQTYQASQAGTMSEKQATSVLKSLPAIHKSTMESLARQPKRQLIKDLGTFGILGGAAGGIFTGANTKEGKRRKRREDLQKKFRI